MITYRQLLKRLQRIPESKLDDPVQVHHPASRNANGLCPVNGLWTSRLLLGPGVPSKDEQWRSPDDNEYHPERYTLLADWNLHAPDGHIATDLMTGEKIWPGGVRKPTPKKSRPK